MVLESTFICIDNSDYMRNGDFIPSRLQSQFEAVNMIGIAKLKSNPENNIGLLSLADNRVLVTLTTDIGKVLSKLHQVKPNGTIDLIRGIKVANLALKHRQGKNHKTRVIVFVASPINADRNELSKLAKRLKKEKVNVDIINFGEEDLNSETLNEFINVINGKEGTGSHLITISAPANLSDALFSSAIVQGEDGSGLPAGFGAGFQYGMMEDDPELAMALRISMEEQRQKQEAEAKRVDSDKMDTDTTNLQSNDDALLQQALAMSLSQNDANKQQHIIPDISSMTEEEQLNYALQMSIAQSMSATDTQSDVKAEATEITGSVSSIPERSIDTDMKEEDEDFAKAMTDPEFLQRVIAELPGVDPNSEAVRLAVDSLSKDSNKSKDTKDKDAKDKK